MEIVALTITACSALVVAVGFFRARHKGIKTEGPSVLLFLVVIAASFVGTAVLYALTPLAPPAFMLAGSLFAFACAVWLFWAYVSNPTFADADEQQAGQTLITTKAFAVVRHPTYVGYAGWWLGACLGLGSPAVAFLATTTALVVFVPRGIREERSWLAGEEADAYRRYAAHVGWLPGGFARGLPKPTEP